MMAGPGMGWTSYVFMAIAWLIIVGLGIWLLAALFPRVGKDPRPGGRPKDPALAILQERYARGEISRREYEEMRRVLTS